MDKKTDEDYKISDMICDVCSLMISKSVATSKYISEKQFIDDNVQKSVFSVNVKFPTLLMTDLLKGFDLFFETLPSDFEKVVSREAVLSEYFGLILEKGLSLFVKDQIGTPEAKARAIKKLDMYLKTFFGE